jgi:hypothetical protein
MFVTFPQRVYSYLQATHARDIIYLRYEVNKVLPYVAYTVMYEITQYYVHTTCDM